MEHNRINPGRLVVGAGFITAGSYATLQTLYFRSGLKLSNLNPSLSGINWEQYQHYIDIYGKPFVDNMISYGVDFGGVLVLIGVSRILESFNNAELKMVEKFWNLNIGLIGIFGLLLELRELYLNLPPNVCANFGCGDLKDLAIFSVLAIYPYLKEKIRRK